MLQRRLRDLLLGGARALLVVTEHAAKAPLGRVGRVLRRRDLGALPRSRRLLLRRQCGRGLLADRHLGRARRPSLVGLRRRLLGSRVLPWLAHLAARQHGNLSQALVVRGRLGELAVSLEVDRLEPRAQPEPWCADGLRDADVERRELRCRLVDRQKRRVQTLIGGRQRRHLGANAVERLAGRRRAELRDRTAGQTRL